MSRAQIVGRLWVLVPGLGGRLQELRSPLTMAILARLATVLLGGGAGVRRVRRRRRRRPQPKFRPTAPGTVTVSRPVPVAVGGGRLRVRVSVARIAGLVGVLTALAAALAAGYAHRRAREADEPTRIRARYGESIVTVVHSSLGRHAGLVEVKSIEELARLAERYDSMIIHEQTDLGHAYLVADGATLYAYLLDAPGAERTLRDRLTSEREPRPATPSTPAIGATHTIPA